MSFSPTIRSKMVTDQNLTGLNVIRKGPPSATKNDLIKSLHGGLWRPLWDSLERALAGALGSIRLNTMFDRATRAHVKI